jgi:hypothetical protein
VAVVPASIAADNRMARGIDFITTSSTTNPYPTPPIPAVK